MSGYAGSRLRLDLRREPLRPGVPQPADDPSGGKGRPGEGVGVSGVRVGLHGGVFNPCAGVKTSILIFRRGGSTERVIFLHADNDGYKPRRS